MEIEMLTKEIIKIPVGWSGYLIGTDIYEFNRVALERMGVCKEPDGYDGMSLFWVEGKDNEDVERRKKEIYEFVMSRK